VTAAGGSFLAGMTANVQAPGDIAHTTPVTVLAEDSARITLGAADLDTEGDVFVQFDNVGGDQSSNVEAFTVTAPP
jgi:hypothetical protein